MGSPTAELARKLMNKEENKMTNHKPEDFEALVKAAKKARDLQYAGTDNWKALDNALTKFAPKPAKVYVIPSWNEFFQAHKYAHPISLTKSEYEQVRELTAIDAPEPAQKWNMPTLQQINEICDHPYGTAPTKALDSWYDAIRNKIMAMND